MASLREEFDGYNSIFRFTDEIAHGLDTRVSFGMAALKNLMLINGGAIVAIPAIVTGFKTGFHWGIIAATAFFVYGLICSLAAYFYSFTAASSYIETRGFARDTTFNLVAIRHMRLSYSQHELDNLEKERIGFEIKRDNAHLSVVKGTKMAMRAAFLSLTSFIVGAGILLTVMIYLSQQKPVSSSSIEAVCCTEQP